MKKVIVIYLLNAFISSASAIGGFGLQLGQGIFTVSESSPESGLPGVTLTNSAFDGSFNLGGYAYIDLIPFLDIELDFNLGGKNYDINFENQSGSMRTIDFGWGYSNYYMTATRKLLGIGIPFLASAKAHYGLGLNNFKTSQLASMEMVKELLGGTETGLQTGGTDDLDEALLSYLENDDNLVESSGFHIQAGLQFKVLTFDTFLLYRHTFIDDVVPGSSGFGALNFRLGLGI